MGKPLVPLPPISNQLHVLNGHVDMLFFYCFI